MIVAMAMLNNSSRAFAVYFEELHPRWPVAGLDAAAVSLELGCDAI